MRIVELELRAFGPFKTYAVRFPQDKGLHILYGPNEAGKTVALDAITDFFFRIPRNTCYGFRHGYENLRIGATLSHGEDEQTLFRRTGLDASLRDDADSTRIDESVLSSMLNNLDKERFRSMFGLDLVQLAEGARQMLEGGGEVGAALFGAATGMPALIRTRKRLNEEMERLFKSSGSKPELNQLLKKRKELEKAIKAKQLLPREYNERRNLREALGREVAMLGTSQGTLDSEISRHKSLLKALPRVRERHETTQALEDLNDVPLLDDAFPSKYQILLQQLRENERIAFDANENLEGIASDLDVIHVDEPLLAQAQRVGELSDTRAANAKALQDRNAMKQEIEALRRILEEDLAELEANMPLSEIESLRVSTKQQNRITQLAFKCDALTTKVRAIQEQRADTKRKREALLNRIEPPEKAKISPALASVVAQARKQGDLETDAENLRSAIRELEEETSIELERLSHWDDTLDALLRASFPTAAQCERFQSDFRDLDLSVKDINERICEQRDALRDFEHRLTRLAEVSSLPSPDVLEQARAIRDRGWSLVREAWTEGKPPGGVGKEGDTFATDAGATDLAHAFEKRLAEADEIADALYRGASTIHERITCERDAAATRDKIVALEQDLEIQQRRRDQLHAKWRTAWSGANIDPDTPETMREWLQQRDSIVKRTELLREQRRESQAVEEKMREHAEAIKTALTAVVEATDKFPTGFAQLLEFADRIVKSREAAIHKIQADRERVAEYGAELSELKDRLEKLEADKLALDKDWAAAMESVGLDSGITTAGTGAALTQRQELFEKYFTFRDREVRIKQIVENNEQFEGEVATFVKEFAPDLADTPANEGVLSLRKRVDEAKQLRDKCDSLLKRRDQEQERLDKADQAVHAAQDELAALCNLARVKDHEDLPTTIRRSNERGKLEDRLKQLDDEISELAGAQLVKDFVLDASESDEATINGELHKLEADHQATRNEREKKIGELAVVQEWLDNQNASGEAAELREEQERVAAKIAHRAERYGRLEIARIVLDRTIDRYRQQHEGPLLKRAGAIFTRLTLGSFSELRVDFDDKGRQVLSAIRKDPVEEVRIEGLSEGTRDQLYLALRIASLQEYVQSHPIPLILDDILVNFDDDRAEAALHILAELSQITQVIYFTHHQHLVDRAHTALPAESLATQHIRDETP